MPGVRDMAQAHPTAGGHGVQCEGLGVTGRERVGSPGAVCGPRTEARPLGVSRRDFLLQGYQCGVGGLSTVELFVCHPLQLLGREVHVPRSRARAGRSTGGVPL